MFQCFDILSLFEINFLTCEGNILCCYAVVKWNSHKTNKKLNENAALILL